MLAQQTTDYEVFQKHLRNRPLHEGNLKKLQKSIQKANMLDSRPILVDKDFNIIDGQHRLEVARRLSIPIWYQVHEQKSINDIILLNNNLKSWGVSDYLNYYCHMESDEFLHYKELNDFVEKHNIDVNIAFHLLNSNRDTGFYKDFKEGLYKFPKMADYNTAIMKKVMVDETREYIKEKTSGNKIYLDRVTFYRALVEFFSNASFSYEVFMKKLQYKINLLHPCSKKEEYIQIFKVIYNWKNPSPIEKE